MDEKMELPSKSQVKRWGKLLQEKYRRREGLFLAEGGKVVGELLRSGRPLEALLVCEQRAGRWESLLAEAPPGALVYRLSDREWGALSQDKTPEGIMAVAAMTRPPQDALASLPRGPLLLLHQVNNPNNLGALLRTAHWFGFSTVYLSRDSVEATHPKVVRTSMGSLFHLTVREEVDFEPLLRRLQGLFHVVGSDVREGVAPHPCATDAALLLGSESHGLPAELLTLVGERWRIPGKGGAESLSLPQAAAVMMYECTREMDPGR